VGLPTEVGKAGFRRGSSELEVDLDAAKQEVGLLEVKRQAILDGNVERSVAMAVL